MNLDIKLNVTAEELYDVLLESVAYEITQVTNKRMKPKQLKKGFSYSKQFKKNRTIKVTILDLDYAQKYQIKCEGVNGTHYICYELEPLEDGVGVSYSERREKLDGSNGEGGLYYLWASFVGKRRVRKMFQQLELHIHMQRQKDEEDSLETDE